MDSAENVNSSRKRRRSSSVQSQSRDGTQSSARSGNGSRSQSDIGHSRRAIVSSKGYNTKANTACETCRLKKVKCNEGQPICSYCDTHGFRCDYRLRTMSSNEQVMPILLKRLARMEEKLEKFEVVLQGGQSVACETRIATDSAVLNTPIATPSGLSVLGSQFQLSADQAWFNLSPESAVSLDRAANNGETPVSFSEEAIVKLRYLGKTPFSCEENRPLLPDFVSHTEPTKPSEIRSWIEYYLQNSCPMYPLMCFPSAHTISGLVATQGFKDDIDSCFILLVVALSKAYKNEECAESGLADFQRATHILSRLTVEFKIKRIQVHVLSAIFLLKKGRLLDFWSSLHTGCTMLYTMLQRDQASGTERSIAEKNNIRRIYWICYNLERDVKNEIDDTLPRSPLQQLEDRLPLPVGCDEVDLSHLPLCLRTMLTFFLAEMSLKAIAARIVATADLEFYIREAENGGVEVSPLLQELRRQLDEWIENVPTFLGWSSEPAKGVYSPLGIRVKLTYWFVRFLLMRPLILRVPHDSRSRFPILGWALFREGLHAGLTLVIASIAEQSDIDVIMGNRILSAICLLKESLAKGYFSAARDEDINAILKAGINMLWDRLAGKSEWMKCKLYSLEARD